MNDAELQIEDLKQKLAEHNLIAATNKENDGKVLFKLQEVIALMRAHKPEERNEKARRYAVSVTEMEKVIAYFKTYVIDQGITMIGKDKP